MIVGGIVGDADEEVALLGQPLLHLIPLHDPVVVVLSEQGLVQRLDAHKAAAIAQVSEWVG